MQEKVGFSDERAGTLEWTLPPELLDVVGQIYPPEQHQAIAEEIAAYFKATAHMFSGVLKMGGEAGLHLHHIKTRQMELLQELKAMAKQALGENN